MTASLISATPQIEMTLNLAGKTRGQLISMAEQLTCQNYNLYVDYNLNFRISKDYDEKYQAERQVILDQMAQVAKAFEQHYLDGCVSERAGLAAA